MMESNAMVEQAKSLIENEDYDEAYRLLLEASLLDENGEAMAYLGRLYFDGEGVDENYDKAGKLFGLAYENGVVLEGWHLIIAGSYYEDRSRIYPEEIELAIRCYREAGERGQGYGYECLAELYMNRGDYKTAYECLMKPRKYNPTGLYLLGKMYEEGLYIEKDMDKAIEYYRRAAGFFDEEEWIYGTDRYSELSRERLCKLKSNV